MIVVPHFKGKTVAVFGLARSGISAARALIAGGAEVVGWDDKADAREAAEHAGVTVSDLAEIDWRGVAALILSPGVPLTHPQPHPFVQNAQEARTEVIGDVELFFRVVRPAEGDDTHPKIVCITGTNGKSTTTALIGHVLSALGYDAEVGGNIGKPILELAPPSPQRAYIIEMSSYQIDLTPSVRPDVAVLINITPDHLDRHGTMEHYASVKANIFRHLARGDHAVIGVDDSYSSEICTKLSARGVAVTPVSIGKVLGRGIFVLEGKLYDSTGAASREVRDLSTLERMPGSHNWQNAAIAYAAVRPLVVDPSEIASAITSFPGLAHRIELVGQVGRVRFVNDSKATNADAAARALACYDDIYWIAGGKAKSGGVESVAPYFGRIKRAYLIGDAMDAFAATLGPQVSVARAGTLEAAMRMAAKDAAEDAGAPVVLLSPACASFDQFRDYEHRGAEFKRVFKLIADEARLKESA